MEGSNPNPTVTTSVVTTSDASTAVPQRVDSEFLHTLVAGIIALCVVGAVTFLTYDGKIAADSATTIFTTILGFVFAGYAYKQAGVMSNRA